MSVIQGASAASRRMGEKRTGYGRTPRTDAPLPPTARRRREGGLKGVPNWATDPSAVPAQPPRTSWWIHAKREKFTDQARAELPKMAMGRFGPIERVGTPPGGSD